MTLDVPGKLNRVSMTARDQLAAVFAELDQDETVRFVVLTGAGGQFTAGGDIAGFLTRSPWAVSQLAKNVAAPERCSKPVIARLEGYVFGVGLELALACDFRIAADGDADGAARGDDRDDPRLGRHAAPGPARRARAGEGHRHARPSRRRRGGARDRARDRGRAAGGARRAVAALVEELSRHSPLALAMAKRVLNTAYDGPLHTGLELEGLAYGLLQQTHDFREGVEAFTEKRKPEFDGT